VRPRREVVAWGGGLMGHSFYPHDQVSLRVDDKEVLRIHSPCRPTRIQIAADDRKSGSTRHSTAWVAEYMNEHRSLNE